MEENRKKAEEDQNKDGRLTRAEENRIDMRIRIGVIIGALIVLAYLIFCAAQRKEAGAAYYIIVAAFIVFYWLSADVIALKLKHGFAGRTEAQKTAYKKMAALDAVGCVGLALFLTGGIGESTSGSGNSSSLIGAMIYLFSVIYARRLRADYEKDPSEPGKGKQDKEEIAKKADISSLPTAADRESRKDGE